MAIGYACVTVGIPGTTLKSYTLARAADTSRVRQVVAANLAALETMALVSARSGIGLLRISSDMVPLASHPDFSFPWRWEFAPELSRIGERIRSLGIRVSMHPGQYTVLNTPRPDVLGNSIRDLCWHADFLDALGMDRTCRIVLHVGGRYGDGPAALERFERQLAQVPEAVRERLTIENDEKNFNVTDVLEVARKTGLPAIFDLLHHALNPPRPPLAQPRPNQFPDRPTGLFRSARTWIDACAETWKPVHGRPKIHVSFQQPGGRRGAHAGSIPSAWFLSFLKEVFPEGYMPASTPDIMLEVKDKNLSAVKCLLLAGGLLRQDRLLEEEWARYKYLVMSRSQGLYERIRRLMGLWEKSGGVGEPVSATVFYGLVEEALALPADEAVGAEVNAAQHVWGYLNRECTEWRKQHFFSLFDTYREGAGARSAAPLKRWLLREAVRQHRTYLLNSLYFYV